MSIANGYWMMLDASQAISAEHRGPDGYTLDVSGFHRIGRTRSRQIQDHHAVLAGADPMSQQPRAS